MPFVKGQSGNPGGRPKELEGIQKLAREHGDAAIRVLLAVAENGKSESARVAAASALLDRGYGKPPQFATNDPEAFRRANELSDDELAAIAAAGRERAAEAPVDPSQLN